MGKLGVRDDLEARKAPHQQIANDRKGDVALEVAVPHFTDRLTVELTEPRRQCVALDGLDTERAYDLDLLHAASRPVLRMSGGYKTKSLKPRASPAAARPRAPCSRARLPSPASRASSVRSPDSP